MHTTLSPVRGNAPRSLSRQGAILTVDGIPFDFSLLGEGDSLPPEAVAGGWLVSDVVRNDGVLHLTVALPHASVAPPETLFPKPLHVTEDGSVDLPHMEKPNEQYRYIHAGDSAGTCCTAR